VDKSIDADYRDAFECAYAHFGEQVKKTKQICACFQEKNKILGSPLDRIRDETFLRTGHFQRVLGGQLSG
jgi:hypothetical protein